MGSWHQRGAPLSAGPVALPNGKVGVAEDAWPGWRLPHFLPAGLGSEEIVTDVDAVRAAQAQGEADAQRRQDFYGSRPGMGVPAGSTGEPVNAPRALLEDRAVAGTGGGR